MLPIMEGSSAFSQPRNTTAFPAAGEHWPQPARVAFWVCDPGTKAGVSCWGSHSCNFPKSHFSSDSFIKCRLDQIVFLSLQGNLAFHLVGPSDK